MLPTVSSTMSSVNSLEKLNYSSTASHIVCVNTLETPVGKVTAAADDVYLYIVTFEDSNKFEKVFRTLSQKLHCKYIRKINAILRTLEEQFACYFDGKLQKFTVPLKTFGSEFQKEVWEKLREIPYASTQTYGGIATAIGRNISHSRAIGAACGANNHVLVIPCHRVVASGSKGGFSSGIDRKEWLLDHEGKCGT